MKNEFLKLSEMIKNLEQNLEIALILNDQKLIDLTVKSLQILNKKQLSLYLEVKND